MNARAANYNRQAAIRAAENQVGGRPPGRERGASIGLTLIPGLTTTVKDRENALAQLHTDFVALRADLFGAMGSRPDHPDVDEKTPLWKWAKFEAIPTFEEFDAFYSDQVGGNAIGAWVRRWATNWDDYVSWGERLTRLREAIRAELAKLKIQLSGPDPVAIPKSPWRAASDYLDKPHPDLTSALKITAIGAAVVGGAILIKKMAGRTDGG